MPELSENTTKNTKKAYIGIGVLTLLIIVMLAFILGIDHFALFKKKNIGEQQTYVRVGNETIYQKDYEKELSYFPKPHSTELQNTVRQKLITDSAILQGAKELGLTNLDATVFNSSTKNYGKRIQKINLVKQKILATQINHVAGQLFAIYFYNGKPARIGLEQGQTLARSKLAAVHTKLKNKEITMQQAIDMIKNDTSLADIDQDGYRHSAGIHFDTEISSSITADPTVDEKIKTLNEDNVSDIFLISTEEIPGRAKIPSHYLFAYVERNVKNKDITSFDAWVKQQPNKLPVI